MAGERLAVVAGVALQGAIQLRLAAESPTDLLGQPLPGLERPAAAHPPERVGRQRRVARECDSGARRRAAFVGNVELAEHLRLALRRVEAGAVRHALEDARHRRLGVAFELGNAVLVRDAGEHRQAVVGREGVGHVGVEEPELRAVPGDQRRVPVVGHVDEAVVRLSLGLQAGELRDLGVAAVGADHEPAAQLALGALAGADADAGGPPAVAQQRGGGLAHHQLDPVGVGGHLAQERVECLAAGC